MTHVVEGLGGCSTHLGCTMGSGRQHKVGMVWNDEQLAILAHLVIASHGQFPGMCREKMKLHMDIQKYPRGVWGF